MVPRLPTAHRLPTAPMVPTERRRRHTGHTAAHRPVATERRRLHMVHMVARRLRHVRF